MLKIASASADGRLGAAEGVARGKALSWSYDIVLKMGGSDLKVRFNDWLFLLQLLTGQL